jgi:hypothetical protein
MGSGVMPRKLKVAARNDALEQEADRVAAQALAARPGHDAFLPAASSQRQANMPFRIQRFSGAASGGAAEAPASVNRVLGDAGQALGHSLQQDMGQRLGQDFSRVRVHTDTAAGQSAREVDAHAYTVGDHVVFGADRYAPETASGRALLAHELVHVVQQSGARDTLQRAPAGTGAAKTAPARIKEVRVNQNSKQRVTATLSDGSTFSDECSTGKGHCCFDASAGAAEGGTCSAARSTQVGNNCTPVGTFTVTKKVGKGPIPFWTQFHDAKSVALHEYRPVTGEPLSHGCVRLHRETAEKIFNGSVPDFTKVVVEGLAKPNCADKTLQTEWEHDFSLAGSTPSDGETIQIFADHKLSKAEIKAKQDEDRRQIREARTEMKSALGVDEKGLDSELAAIGGGATVQSKIPRCGAAVTKEEAQLPAAKTAGFLEAAASKAAADFIKRLKATFNAAGAEKVVKEFGEKLWQQATSAARGGGAGSDDRQLYWTRLMLSSALRDWNPWWAADADTLRRLQAKLLNLLEQTSRGMTTAVFGKEVDQKRILISGFDPFGFHSGGDIRQSNLSGAAAQALDGETLTDGKVSAQVQSVVYPVRYADFNEGMVENFLRPQLAGAAAPHLAMSISQGSTQFELEEFAGRRRSTDQFKDNQGQLSGGSPTAPIEAPGLGAGPEFLATNVPPNTLKSMRGAVGRSAPINAETEVKDLPPGATQPRTLPAGPGTKSGQAVEGSGGGFLSNEIFYRNNLLRSSSGSKVPVIHLHTPMLKPGETDSLRNTLIETIRRILRAALSGI